MERRTLPGTDGTGLVTVKTPKFSSEISKPSFMRKAVMAPLMVVQLPYHMSSSSVVGFSDELITAGQNGLIASFHDVVCFSNP